MASQQLSNDGSYLTETRHRHKSSQRKTLNEQGQPNIVNAANHKRTHSPQISMSFCPEKCTCGFTNRTNRLEVKSHEESKILQTIIISDPFVTSLNSNFLIGRVQWLFW